MTHPTKKLGGVCEIIMGQSPPSYTYNENKKGLPFYQGKKDYSDKYPTPRIWCSEPIKTVESGDILISVRAPVGALNIAKEKSCIGRGLTGLRAGKKLNQDFLFHFLKSKEKDIASLGTGSTFTAISKKHLENIEIPLPPLEIQKKIVERIEKLMGKIDEAKKLRKEATADASSLIPSALNKIFEEGKKKGWEEKTIGDLCIINPRADMKNLAKDMEVSFVPMKAVDEKDGIIKIHETRKLSEVAKGYTYFANNDVLFAKITPCMENGKSAIAKDLKNGIGFGSTEFHVLRTRGEILPELIHYHLRQKSFRDEAQNKMTGSAGQKRVPKDFIEKTKILLPPLPEQKKIVKYLDSLSEKVSKIKTLQSATDRELKLLEKSILNSAFGE